jgi:hypothetical protein
LISTLRGPAIQALLQSGALQMTLFDQRDMASITAPEFPGERLIACRNTDLVAERVRKPEDLLAATEKDLTRIKAAFARKRDPLRSATEIALAVGEVLNAHKMPKHFDLDITDAAFGFTREAAEIATEAATDGLYDVPPRCWAVQRPCAATNPWPWRNAHSAASRPSIWRSVRCITGQPIGCAGMCFSACWPTTSNGTCASGCRDAVRR